MQTANCAAKLGVHGMGASQVQVQVQEQGREFVVM